MTLSPQFLDELKSRTVLSALINRDLPLKKAGREWRACCPYHNEKTPSFYVNDEKAFFHCHGCSAHGDAIRWLTDQKGLTFMDAVRQLADAAGMEVPAARPGDAEREAKMERIYEIMARAASFYGAVLGTEARAIAYLDDRRIGQAIRATFGIGWAPNSRKGEKTRLEAELQDAGDETLVAVGLRRANTDGEIYDFFRGRIIIPIHDSRGRVIAFGGRIIGAGEPKYLNSPDTPLFDKGRSLFNIHRAAPMARRNGRLIIVEGYMDVIAVTGAGIPEVAAPNGTALTEAQLQIAWRLVDEPIVCFDGDAAGKKAMVRAAFTALPILEPGKSLRFASLPAGQDPDDVIRQGGLESFTALISSPRALVDVIWEAELTVQPVDTPEQRAGFYTRLGQRVSTIRNPIVGQAYGDDILARYNARFSRPTGRENRHQSKGETVQREATRQRPTSLLISAALITGMARYREVVEQEMETICAIDWGNRKLAMVAGLMVDSVSVTGNAFDVEFDRAGVTDLFAEIQRAVTLPFSFVAGAITIDAAAELVDALRKMPRK